METSGPAAVESPQPVNNWGPGLIILKSHEECTYGIWRLSSAVERLVYTERVGGSIPSAATRILGAYPLGYPQKVRTAGKTAQTYIGAVGKAIVLRWPCFKAQAGALLRYKGGRTSGNDERIEWMLRRSCPRREMARPGATPVNIAPRKSGLTAHEFGIMT